MAERQDRQAQLAQLGDALQAAAARADWNRLGEHARALPAALNALAAQGPWSAAERRALDLLRVRHDAAAGQVAGAARTLGARLQEMGTNKDGWLAYALVSETESGMHQETR